MRSRFCRGFASVVLTAALAACSSNAGQIVPGSSQSGSSSTSRALASQSVAGAREAARGLQYVRASRGPAISSFVASPDRIVPDGSTVVYDSIGQTGTKGQPSSYISSLGYDCCSTAEFGDGLVFANLPPNGAQLKTVTVIFDSWACQQGTWYGDNCVTAKNATFQWPVTINVYSVTGYGSGAPQVGSLLTTRTYETTFKYRPSANNKVCQGPNLGAFLGPVDKQCDNGLAQSVTFNMVSPKTILPAQAIVTVAYNTSSWGYSPVGTNTACFTSSAGCPYDSLNVSADGNGALPGMGGNLDANGVFVNFQDPYFYCAGTGSGLIDDSPCWTGYHPELKVVTF
jgi:hypothetical protein